VADVQLAIQVIGFVLKGTRSKSSPVFSKIFPVKS